MKPTPLRTARLVLDQPTADDIDLVTEYCQDPVFEQFLSTPWPYRRRDAEKFVGQVVPGSWNNGTEATWAIREDGVFLGLIGFRTLHRDLGFWLGAPHRGRGIMPEAIGAVLDWAFELGDADVQWECFLGNAPSAAAARKAGFSYRGRGPSLVAARDGFHPEAEKASIARTDSRDPKPGWPVFD